MTILSTKGFYFARRPGCLPDHEEARTRPLYLAISGRRDGGDYACAARLSARLRMLMPLLVRLNDSQIEVMNGAVAKVATRVDDRWGILEQLCSGCLLVEEQALPPDLDVNPIDGDIERGGQLYGAEQSRFMRPSVARRLCLDPAARRRRCTVIGKTLSSQLGEWCPSRVSISAISSSGMPVRASSSRRARRSSPRVSLATELTFILTRRSVTAPPRHTILAKAMSRSPRSMTTFSMRHRNSALR